MTGELISRNGDSRTCSGTVIPLSAPLGLQVLGFGIVDRDRDAPPASSGGWRARRRAPAGWACGCGRPGSAR